MKIKTNKLTDNPLNWAVAVAGFLPGTARSLVLPELRPYCTEWLHGGPIIEREIHSITDTTMRGDMNSAWVAKIHVGEDLCITMYGPTPLIAAMRCYVASKLGDEVEVPDGLALDALIYETTPYEGQ
jgi:hypothetical protein